MVLQSPSPQAPSSQYRRVLRSGSALLEKECNRVNGKTPPVSKTPRPLRQPKASSRDVKSLFDKPVASGGGGSRNLQRSIRSGDSPGPPVTDGSPISRGPIPPRKPVNRPAVAVGSLQPNTSAINSPTRDMSSKSFPKSTDLPPRFHGTGVDRPRPASTDIQLLESNRKRRAQIMNDSQPREMIDDIIPPRGQVFQQRRKIEGLDRAPSSFEEENPTYSETNSGEVQTPHGPLPPSLKRKAESEGSNENQHKRKLRIVGGPGARPNTPGIESPIVHHSQSYNGLQRLSVPSPISRRSTATPLREFNMGFGRLNVLDSPVPSQSVTERENVPASRFFNVPAQATVGLNENSPRENFIGDARLLQSSHHDTSKLSNDLNAYSRISQLQQNDHPGSQNINSQKEPFDTYGASQSRRPTWTSGLRSPSSQTPAFHTPLSQATSNVMRVSDIHVPPTSELESTQTIASIQFDIIVKAEPYGERDTTGSLPFKLATTINIKTPNSENVKAVAGDHPRGA